MNEQEPRLKIVQGDILQDKGMLVIPVNLVPGVMGAGLAKQFADVCPEAKKEHSFFVRHLHIKIGDPSISYDIYKQPVCFFPTKENWRMPSKLEWVSRGLRRLSNIAHWIDVNPWWQPGPKIYSAESMRNAGIAMPALGCGLGGLEWKPVSEAISEFANSLPDGWHVRLYRPHNSNE